MTKEKRKIQRKITYYHPCVTYRMYIAFGDVIGKI